MKINRIISLFLVLTVLLSLLPAGLVSANTAEESTGYNYVFTSEALPDELKNSSKYVTIDKFEGTTTDTPIAAVSDPWKIAAHFYAKNIQARPASGLSGNSTYTGFNVWTDTSKSNTYFAIEVKVGKGGTYVPSLKYFETPLAPKVKIWLVKGGTTSNNVNTSEFEYQAKASTGNDRLMSLYNYASKLGNGGEDKYLLAEELDMYGEFTQGDAAITKTFDELTLESGSYFLIFHKTGSQATSGDLQISLDSFSLETPQPEDELLSLSLTAGADSVLEGNTLSLKATAKYSVSGEVRLAEGVTYKSANEAVATVSQKGVITGIKAGRATITATVDGTDISDEFIVTVKELKRGTKEYLYDFRNLAFGSSVNITQSELAEMTLETVKPEVSAPWKVASQNYIQGVTSRSTGLNLSTNRDSGLTCLAIELKNEEGGLFLPKLTYTAASGAPIVDVFLVKEGTTSGGKTTDDFDFVDGIGNDYRDADIWTFTTNITNETDGIYILKRGLDMYADSSEEKVENFGKRELALEEDTSYFLIFRVIGRNEKCTANYMSAVFESFSISPPAGDFDELRLSVRGLTNEQDAMVNMTERQLEFKLYDDIGIMLDEIDEAKLSAEYTSSDKSVATVSEDGVISTHSNGKTTITAKVTYNNIVRSDEYNLTVESVGKNLFEHLNPDFEGDEWVWDSERQDEAPEEPVFVRSGIVTEEKNGDRDNRAFAFVFNPDVPMPSGLPSVYLNTKGQMIEAEPGKFYQLSFKVKADIKKPDDGDYPIFRYALYAYKTPSSTSSSNFVYSPGKNVAISDFENWQEKFSEWQEFVVPIVVSTAADGSSLYLSPRLDISKTDVSIGKSGYSGTVWVDDIELREVGFAGVDVEISGDPSAAGGGSFSVLSKPYTTLGHNISISSNCLPAALELASSDVNVVSDFEAPKLVTVLQDISVASSVAKTGGKNSTAEISAAMTLNGITRSGSAPVTTSGYDMKLLYAELRAEPGSVAVEKNAQLVPTGFMSDGTAADMTGGRIIYESLTPDIVSVSESGEITPLRAGKGKVSATLILNSNSAYAETEIEVTDSSAIESASLSAPETVGYLRDEPLILTGKMTSGYDADFTNAKINWIIGSDPENGVTIDEDNHLVFGNIKGAIATISAEIELGGGKVKTNEVAVTVGETDLRDFIINFGGVNEKSISNVTIEKYGWQLDVENSHSSVLTSLPRNTYMNVYTNGVDRDFVIDFNVPYTGYYMPVFVAGYKNDYGAEKVYIYIDGAYVGDYEFFAGKTDARNLRAVYLEAGPHKFTLRPAVENTLSRNYYQYPGLLRFAAIPSLPVVEKITTEKESYEIAKGNTASVSAKIRMSDGFIYEWQKMRNSDPDPFAAVEYLSDDADVAAVDENGTVTATGEGEATITVKVTLNNAQTTKEIPVTILPEGTITADEALESVEIDAPYFVMNPENEGVQLTAVGKNAKGATVDMTGAEIIWEIEDNSVAQISEKGFVTPLALGSAKVTVTVTHGGITKTDEAYVSVREGKVGRTYYTDDMVAAARENIKKYSWAKDEAEAAIDAAEKYLGLEDALWEMVPGEGIPRSITVGLRNDPNRYTCRYCGIDILQNYTNYAWISNPLQRPWKVQCPDCKRLFPSNEFDKFYELGRDEHGVFNRELALERHEEKFGGTYGTGYLKNTMYPEVGTENSSVKLTGSETPEKWGVDDGFGYDTGRVYSNGVKEIHTYIAYYNHFGLWFPSGKNPGTLIDAVETLAEAYIFTGDEKYGKVGAILTDRLADVYPEYDMSLYSPTYEVSDGGAPTGITIGNIWECDNVRTISRVYDAFFPMYDDPEVISFLSEKAKKYNNTEKNDKSTPDKIRENIEDGVLRESFEEVQRYSISGNFGATQSAIGMAAVVLDSHPETDEIIDWLYAYRETDYRTYQTGGEINTRLVDGVSRDGQGDESGPGYNRIWVNGVTEVAKILANYDEYEGVDLYEHPKFIGMIKSYAPLTLLRRGLAQIGDSGRTGIPTLYPDNDDVMINAFKETKDVEIAQHLYFIKGGDLKNIHYDIFTKNPESLKNEVEEIIETHGEYNYDKSSMLTGYGFGALRDGTLYKAGNSTSIKDTQRDFWMYFGGARSHSHSDRLNLGVEAYGLQLTSDLGYPETASADPNRNQWQSATISHNTVVVNEMSQDSGSYSGVPLHFDTKDTRVKVMDVDAAEVYASTDEYRRTIVMVDFDDEISYGIDFFKVLGGNDHLYSFHASAEEDPETSDNLKFKAQLTGSYASVAVPYGEDPWSVSGSSAAILKYPVGYTWLNDVKRADNPGTGEFYVDWKIKDFWKQSRNGKQDIHLRMTMVNDWAADEVTLANGMPPRGKTNLDAIDHYEYMLVRRKGRDMNTLFTTVVEPYDGSRYIKSISNVPVTVVGDKAPGKNEVVKAVKVELIDGRIDYIVYAQNNEVTYNVGDVFEFRGFVGVWTTDKNGVNIYSYVNDGEMIGDDTFKYENLDAAIRGTITDFQDELSFDNWIEAELDCALTQEEADDLSGRIINVEREAPGNSTYVIESVKMLDGTHARINLGNVTLISGFVDAKNEELGYKYDVGIGKTFDIPMSYEDNSAPVFEEVEDNITTSAGSSIKVTVNATGDDGATVTYRARTLPRGASFNAENGTFTWKPDSSQIGDNLVAIDAVDNYGRISTQYFTVTVYGSTTGSKNETSETPEAGNTDTPAGGGGGGGGGAVPTPDTETTPDDTESTDENDNIQNGGETAPDASGETDNIRFTDLGNHAWAEDAINSLAEDGVIKGTTARTYSPANNITRADFALLLVRAFKLSSDNTENFADVMVNDYYASELAIARNTGIVNGIGDNKYAPRNTITRQDMMVIVYRAMNALASPSGRGVTEGGGEGKDGTNSDGGGISPSQSLAATALPKGEPSKAENYPDFTTVAPYAQDAVSALIGADLVNGKSGRIAPTDYTTRAEVAVLIKRILDYIK